MKYLLFCNMTIQGCQLSRIIQETPDFEPFLLVSRLESEISQIIAEVLPMTDRCTDQLKQVFVSSAGKAPS